MLRIVVDKWPLCWHMKKYYIPVLLYNIANGPSDRTMKLTIKLTHSHMHTNTHTLQTHSKKEYENRTTTKQTTSVTSFSTQCPSLDVLLQLT